MECLTCGARVPDQAPSCPECGGDVTLPASRRTDRGAVSGRATTALLLNLLVWPGLGSLVARESVGWIQVLLAALALALFLGVGGSPLMLLAFAAVWLWGVLTAARVLREVGAMGRVG